MSENQTPFRFRRFAWKQFKKNKPAIISLYVLCFLILIAALAPILANQKPLYAVYKGNTLFPAFTFKNYYEIKDKQGNVAEKISIDVADWKHFTYDHVLWPPVAYSPGKSDWMNENYVAPDGSQKFSDATGQTVAVPLRFRHWLGTGQRGDDVMAGLIHGTRISLSIGLISMFIALLIGVVLGSLAGYFGDNEIATTRGQIIFLMLGSVLAWFYAFRIRTEQMNAALQQSGTALMLQLLLSFFIFILILLVFWWMGKYAGKIFWLKKKLKLPLDAIVSRLIEILVSLPLFLLILSIAAISKPSIYNVMIIIGFTAWTGIARLTRAEMLRIKHLDYIQSARASGLSNWRIIAKHALPNAIAPAIVSFSFGVANAILYESALSFIGIGVPANVTTWGSLANAGRMNFQAWWLVLFPGLMIFITVTVYNLIGEGLRDALDPKLKK